MKKAALYVGIIAALICGTTFAAVISGTSVGSSAVYTTPVPAQYVAASYGSALANESIAAGTDTALYCAMDNLDGTTSTPECGLNAIRHKGVGPGSTTNYLQATVATTTDIRAASGIWTECFIWRSDSLAAAQGIFSLATGATGRSVSVAATTGAVSYYVMSGGYVAASVGTIRAADTNLFCAGRDSAGKLYWNFNGTAGGGAVYSYTAPAGAQAEFARAGAVALNGHLFEYAFADAEPTPASLAAIWTSVSTCRTRGRCLPNIGTLTSGGTFALVGDDYIIGSNWCGDSTCSRYVAPVGVVPTREARYSWPLLTPTQNGTVPRVATSGLHPKGYGARHASIGPFSNTNNLSLPAGNILGGGGDQTVCMIYKANSCASFYGLFGSSRVSTSGWQITQSSACTVYATVFIPSAGDIGTKAAAPNTTHVVCGGKAGSLWSLKLDDNAVESYALTMVTGNNTTLLGDNAGAVGLNGEIYEFFATTTPATAEYLTYLTDAAMRCTTQGNCFPRDANTVMHCNGDEFTGSVLRCGVNTGADAWTTNGTVALNAPSFYNSTAQRISASGAGPYSSANSFQWGTGSDVLDFPGSWTVCSSFDVTTASGQVINGGYDAGTQTGWAMTYVSGKLQCAVSTASGGAGTADTASTAASDGSLNLGCCGWDQNTDTIYALLNAAPIATGTKKYAPALTLPSYIGRRNAAGTELGGRVYEVLALNKAPTTAQLETIQRRWLNHQSLTGQALSNTHTIDTSTYHSAGKVWRRGANMQRQESARLFVSQTYSGEGVAAGPHQQTAPGFLIHGGYENTAYSISPTGYTEGVTVTSNAALAPDGTMTATAVRERAGTTLHQLYMGLAGSATAGNKAYVASLYLRPVGAQNCLRAVYYPHLATLAEYSSMDIDLAADKQSTYTAGMNTPVNGHEHLADGWLRLWWASGSAPYAAGSVIGLGIRIQPGPSPCTGTTWVGSTAYGYDLWMPSHTTSSTTTSLPSLFPQPLCGNSGLSTTCTAETVTVPNPLRPNGTDWTNLLLQSEDLATTWTAAGATVTSNTALAPDGSFTADKVTNVVNTHSVYQTVTGLSSGTGPFVASGYMKAEAGTATGSLAMQCAAGSATSCSCAMDKGSCSVAAVGANCVAWSDFTTIYDRIQVSGNCTSAATSVTAVLAPGRWLVSTGTIIAANLQLETKASASPYCPTTTTARTCGPGGATGKTVTNNVPYSEALDQVAGGWSRTGLNTVVANAIAGPPNTGIVHGDLVVEDGANSTHYLATTYTATATTWSMSFYGKAKERSWVVASNNGGVSAVSFNLATCAVGTIGGPGTTAAAESIGDGWCRCTLRVAVGAGAASLRFWLANADYSLTYPGDNASGLYIAGVQTEPVPAAGPYCGPTAAASRTCAPKQRWCVRVKDATPGYGRPWASTLRALWSIGDIYGGVEADAAGVYMNGTLLNFDVVGLSGTNTCAVVHSLTSGTHTVTTCVLDGVRTIYIDDVLKRTCSATGPVARFRTPVTIGNNGAGSYAAWDGTIGSIDFNTTGDPKDFPSDRRTP